MSKGGKRCLCVALFIKPILGTKKGFENIKLPAKLLDYFLRRSIINQSLRSWGFFASEQRGNATTILNRRRTSPPCLPFTVFGKHCECNAQKCTHLKRLPPLASHLLLLNHCVLTQHEGQKKMSKAHDRLRDSNRQHWSLLTMRLSIVLCVKSNPMGRFLDCQMPTF